LLKLVADIDTLVEGDDFVSAFEEVGSQPPPTKPDAPVRNARTCEDYAGPRRDRPWPRCLARR